MIKLGDLLLEKNLINKEQLDISLKAQKLSHDKLGEVLENLDFVTSLDVAKVLAQQNELEFINLQDVTIDNELRDVFSKDDSLEYKILPFEKDENILKIATSNINLLDVINFLNRSDISNYELYFCDDFVLNNYRHILYEHSIIPIEKQIEDLIHSTNHADNVDAILLTNLILEDAINKNATDIHITPNSEVSSIFYRIDGVLKMMYASSTYIHKRIVSAIKVRSDMDISNTNLPQDGSMKYKYINNEYDFRISSIPTFNGENIVIRILPKNSSLFNLNNLGFSKENQQKLEQVFLKPYGLVLIVGPTGSGKTTTLYSALRKINSIEKNIITVEDPIEYSFNFIRQTQVNNIAGYTFDTALRHFMRQDPDVMLVGEIRDEQSASLALKASITGHLVLSTVHANSAIDALPRLYDLNVKPSFLSLGLLSVVAQRLTRKLCDKCKEPYKINTKELFSQVSYENQDFKNKNISIFKASDDGCENCNFTGYKGRVAIIEIFEINEKIKSMLSDDVALSKITKKAKEFGMKSLKDDAVDKIIKGITSIDEINRILN